MTGKARGGLGRSLAALIPTGPDTTTVADVLINGAPQRRDHAPLALVGAAGGGLPDQPAPAGKGNLAVQPAPEPVTDDKSIRSGPKYVDVPIDDIRRTRAIPDRSSTRMPSSNGPTRSRIRSAATDRGPAAGDGGYELVMGERRWRAAQRAGLSTIPAIVRRTEDADLLRDALLENIHRAQLNPLEEAAAYQQLLEEFDVTQEELAPLGSGGRPHISNTIRLLKLPPSVQRRVAAGVLSAGHARALLSLPDPVTRSSWPPGSSRKGCPCAVPRRSSRSATPTSRPPRHGRRGRRASPTRGPARSRVSWPTAWTPESRSTAARPRAG